MIDGGGGGGQRPTSKNTYQTRTEGRITCVCVCARREVVISESRYIYITDSPDTLDRETQSLSKLQLTFMTVRPTLHIKINFIPIRTKIGAIFGIVKLPAR